VRTTLSLDDDVATRVKSEVRRSGRPFKEVVNDLLRAGLSQRSREKSRRPPFRIQARDLGALRPGQSLDNIGALLEIAEGPRHR
jgi:5-enolpyruvylshikimate-3-phosphate synthase